MRIKLAVSDEQYEQLRTYLTSCGIEIDDDAPFVLTEANRYVDHLTVKNQEGQKCHIATTDIMYVESFGHNIEVHERDGVYQAMEPLYQLCDILDPCIFCRISNSVIINKKFVTKISPGFSRRFTLSMRDGARVDVTRSYYEAFKEFLGI